MQNLDRAGCSAPLRARLARPWHRMTCSRGVWSSHVARALCVHVCGGRTPTKDIYREVSSCTACIACAAHACTRVRVRLPPSASNDTQCASGLTCGLGTAKVRRIVLPTGQYLTSTPCVVCAVFVCVHVCTVAIGPPSASSGMQCTLGLMY